MATMTTVDLQTARRMGGARGASPGSGLSGALQGRAGGQTPLGQMLTQRSSAVGPTGGNQTGAFQTPPWATREAIEAARARNAAPPRTAPRQNPLFSGSRGSDQSSFRDTSIFTASHAFNVPGVTPSWMAQMPGFVSSIPVMSAGGDAHMPAGTGTLETAQRIGLMQAARQMTPPFRGGGAVPRPGSASAAPPRSGGPQFRNLQTGQTGPVSYATDAQGAFRGGLPSAGGGGAPLGYTNVYWRPGMPIPTNSPVTDPFAAAATTPATTPAPGPEAGAVGEVGTTITDPPIFDQAFIQQLVNRSAESARMDPREAIKAFDNPGLSRDEGQYARALPSLGASRAAANQAMAQIPLFAEIANRQHQLGAQGARGNEALALANILRQLQGTQDFEQTALLGALLDPFVALLSRG